MSERILKALMQLFAIVAKVDIIEGSDEIVAAESSKAIVRTFLKQELTSDLVEKYLKIFFTRGSIYHYHIAFVFCD